MSVRPARSVRPRDGRARDGRARDGRVHVAAPSVALTLLVAALALPARADDAVSGACDGVLVVVDPGGTEPTVRCAAGDPSDGFAALELAGHTVEVLARQPAFVCRIDGRPADDPCVAFPPVDAYWGAWVGTVDGWTYASVGARDADPAPGDVVGWAFGAGDPPRVDVASLDGADDVAGTDGRTDARADAPDAVPTEAEAPDDARTADATGPRVPGLGLVVLVVVAVVGLGLLVGRGGRGIGGRP